MRLYCHLCGSPLGPTTIVHPIEADALHSVRSMSMDASIFQCTRGHRILVSRAPSAPGAYAVTNTEPVGRAPIVAAEA